MSREVAPYLVLSDALHELADHELVVRVSSAVRAESPVRARLHAMLVPDDLHELLEQVWRAPHLVGLSEADRARVLRAWPRVGVRVEPSADDRRISERAGVPVALAWSHVLDPRGLLAVLFDRPRYAQGLLMDPSILRPEARAALAEEVPLGVGATLEVFVAEAAARGWWLLP